MTDTSNTTIARSNTDLVVKLAVVAVMATLQIFVVTPHTLGPHAVGLVFIAAFVWFTTTNFVVFTGLRRMTHASASLLVFASFLCCVVGAGSIALEIIDWL